MIDDNGDDLLHEAGHYVVFVFLNGVGHGVPDFPLCTFVSSVVNAFKKHDNQSELARVFFGPAFNYYFFLGVELDGIAALAVQDAEEAVLPSAEREIGHGRGHADVDSDIAGGRFIAETSSRRTARCKQRRLIAVLASLEKREGFVQIAG